MWSAQLGHRIYLDANAIIYALETEFSDTELSRSLIDAIDKQLIYAVTSELTIAEVLVKPLEAMREPTIIVYESFFSSSSQVELVAVSRDLIVESAKISAKTKVKLPDAIHIATAQASHCTFFLTHDERLGRALPENLQWLRFSDLAP